MTQQIEEAGVHASRRGRGITRYLNDFESAGGVEVLTNGIVYNLAEGTQFMLTQAFAGVETVSEDCVFEIVITTAADGGGDVVAGSAHVHVYTGASKEGSCTFVYDFRPPFCIKYSSGARSITVRIDSSTESSVISCGFNGWWEPET